MQRIKPLCVSFLFLLSCSAITLRAQVDRSQPPMPGPAPEIQFSKPVSFTLDNGLQVIVSKNHEMPLVSFQLTVDADPVREGDAVGYVSAAGNLIRNGTENLKKAEIDQAVDFIGGSLNTYTNGLYASCLSKKAEKMLDIISEVVMHPTYPAEEIEKYKKKAISGLKSSETDASYISGRVSRKLRNKNHPYGELTTIETVKNITREHCVSYYNNYYRPNISYLVMVGDITPEKAKVFAAQYFGRWAKKSVPQHTYNFPKRHQGKRVAMVHKEDAVQSVVSITYPVDIQVGDPDAIPARVMNGILGGGVFSGYLMQNLREDKGYTYGARSSLVKDAEVGYFKASAEVGTEVTDSAVQEFLHEMNRIRNEPVDPNHLDLVRNVITGQFARSLEDPRTRAKFALNTKRFGLPENYYMDYLKAVEKVSAEEIRIAAQKYVLPEEAIILVVGDKKKVSAKLKRFSGNKQVEWYDHSGTPLPNP